MRPRAWVAGSLLLALSCGPSSSSAAHSPSASAPRTSSPSTTASAPTSPAGLSGAYGLLLSAGTLYVIKPDASVEATATLANPSVQYCSSAHDGALLAPPVSASNDQVYFRDGDTKIRMVQPPAGAVDVTTVPGGATTISFFSISPDDQRIAVLVEDLSPATTANLRLYVEDLHGGGHHTDIYTTSTPKGKGGSTLWPMGWHQGMLVLAVVPICTFEPAGLSPSAWHVVDASTAIRKVNIAGSCVLSYWPSPAGVACVGSSTATVYDWSGQVLGTVPTNSNDYQSGLKPSGGAVFFSTGTGIGAPPPAMRIAPLIGGGAFSVPGHTACLWIDDTHVLGPDAVIEFPSGVVTPLPSSGVCAGRFPGGL